MTTIAQEKIPFHYTYSNAKNYYDNLIDDDEVGKYRGRIAQSLKSSP